ncbi:MAG: Trk system potassium transporter TrkA [Clostridiales bacterium]|jgi:trk system potassium uptake protein TrkA|nr:Trk system potassium transporter TrkA [Clostridiales bacterium]
MRAVLWTERRDMKIVIVGDGKVGYALTHELANEGHDVVVIDNNPNVLKKSQEALDVAVVEGNGANVDVQREADVPISDILIAATSRDEVNLLCCMTARKLGCKNTIARVRNPEYDQNLRLLKEELGLSLHINPERTAAKEIFRLLQYPSFLKRDSFAKGRVELVELKLKDENMLAGKQLLEMNKLGFGQLNALVCTVDRGGDVTIPSGSFRLMEGDKITIAADATELAKLLRLLHVDNHATQSVMIIGGGRISVYLALLLARARVQITIIEKSRERCERLCELIPDAMVINGDGTAQDLLLAEGLESTGALVTLTDMDEENLIISMFGNFMGVPKTITKINRTEYTAVFEEKGIDTIVSPKQLTADEIISYVRAIGNTSGGSIVTLYRIMDGEAEAIEFFIQYDCEASYLHVSLQELRLKPNILIAAIIRARKVIIPKGGDYMQKGDTVVVIVAASMGVSDIKDIFVDGIYRMKD